MVDFRCPEGVPSVDEHDLPGNAAQQQRICRRRIATPNHHDGLSLVEHAVAGRAVGHAASHQLLFLGEAQFSGIGARCQHDGFCVKGSLAGFHNLWIPPQIDALHLRIARLCAEALRLPLHLLGQFIAANAVHKAGIVVDLVGQRHLSSCGKPLDHQRIKARSGCVQRRGISTGTTADDDRVVQVLFGCLLFFGHNARQKCLDRGLGLRRDDGIDGLSLHIKPKGRDQLQLLPERFILIHINLDHLQPAGILLGDLFVGGVDLAAMWAPGGPEVHQNGFFAFDEIPEFPDVYVLGCHVASSFCLI